MVPIPLFGIYALDVHLSGNTMSPMPIQLEKQKANLGDSLTRKLMEVEADLFRDFPVLLAGGAVRKAMFGEKLDASDIDVFFQRTEDFLKASEYIKSLGVNVRKHPNCHGFTLYKRNHRVGTSEGVYIQMISKEAYPTMEELLGRFDISVCQFGYTNSSFYFTKQAYQDECTKTLDYAHTSDQQLTLTRYVKYLGLGYTPTINVFEKAFLQGHDCLYGSSNHIDDAAILYNAV